MSAALLSLFQKKENAVLAHRTGFIVLGRVPLGLGMFCGLSPHLNLFGSHHLSGLFRFPKRPSKINEELFAYGSRV